MTLVPDTTVSTKHQHTVIVMMTIVIHVVMMGELLGGCSRGVWRHGESVCEREQTE